MLSFQDMYTQAQQEATDTDSTILTFLKRNINVGLHILESELGSFYMEETWTDTTTNGTNVYQAPDRFVRLKAAWITLTGSTIRYPMTEVFDEDLWQSFQRWASSSKSNIQTKIFCRRDTYEIFPTPSVSTSTINLIYESSNKDLSYDDVTAGSITTLANAGTAVTGSGSAWDSTMINRYFKINAYPVWYPISAVGSTTTLTLQKKYQGTSIAAGSSSYTIGEFPRTPPSTHIIPIYFSLWQYFMGPKQNAKNAILYKQLFESELARAKATYGRRYSSKVIPNQNLLRDGVGIVNPNFYPNPLT